ncbi:MAG: CxxxxCH/CxxCH domain-containing protein [Bacteroidetes bacterium]|nr:CxxxxCH/CxxCH domain-containing protein [Bacteroidota bacterium]
MKTFVYQCSILIILAFLLPSCSERKEEKLPTVSTLTIHEKGFADTTSSNFHAKYLLTINNDITKCQQCHGKNLTGGTTKASCYDCHTVVHGKDFGDVTSQNFHAKYLQGTQYNVQVCQKCHGVDFRGKGDIAKSCIQCHSSVHDKSFGDSTSANFHTKFIQSKEYDIQSCKQCHGDKLDGKGVAVKSCLTCHTSVHDATFGDSTSLNYHARFIQSNGYNVASCQTCHGTKFDGKGVAKKNCQTCHSSVHDKSFGNSASPNFHAKFIQGANYEVESCKQCHGTSFDGKGVALKSCKTCHASVHDKSFGDATSPNFHTKYLQSNNYEVTSCQQCHGTSFDGKGVTKKSCYQCHTVMHDKTFGDQASPNFHANFIKSSNYNLVQCQSCHGPQYNGNGVAVKSCVTCHNQQSGPENCSTCHGGATNAAPPKDLSGNTLATFRGVGAHQTHLNGESISKGFSCNECHVVPATLSAVGHIDASVNAEVVFNGGSKFFKADAGYNASTISCANTYCHGNFTGGNNLTMTWNNTLSSAAACGTCHGDATKSTLKEKAFPKSGHNRFGTISSDCSTCHVKVVDAALNIINPSLHVNGIVD